MSSALDSCWEETDQPVNRRPGQRRVATMGKVGRSWVELPKVVGQMLIMPGFWLCGLLMTLFLALYVLIPALLLDYLPGRLFGYYQGTRRLDAALAVTLLAIAGLVIWGKIDRRLEPRCWQNFRRKDGSILRRATPTRLWVKTLRRWGKGNRPGKLTSRGGRSSVRHWARLTRRQRRFEFWRGVKKQLPVVGCARISP
ncbi:MAG: hypothetical protein EBT95_02685 [Verrucomicrobia bacterium]|nr:hypothetical protein [Verrucomicrobiota bacterium]